MKILKNRYIKMVLLILFIFGSFIMYNMLKINNKSIDIKGITEEEFTKNINAFSTWIVYWDLDVDDKISSYDSKIKSVSYFEAYFNDDNKLEIPEKLIDYKDETKKYEFEKYLSITNDIVHESGNSSTKDKDILTQVLYSEELANKNIEEIINLAKKNNFDGVEMDYENLKNDVKLWVSYINFLEKLYKKCSDNNLKLRVVLEPTMPNEQLNFIEGPTYAMMCYNLHDLKTKPGEKTNIDFINKLIEKIKYIPGKKEFAIPNGGFDWAENNENSSAVTQSKAENLAQKYNANISRDPNSGYLYFSYNDEDNSHHDIWYADEKTLQEFIKVIQDKGYEVGIWRASSDK